MMRKGLHAGWCEKGIHKKIETNAVIAIENPIKIYNFGQNNLLLDMYGSHAPAKLLGGRNG